LWSGKFVVLLSFRAEKTPHILAIGVRIKIEEITK
jgi:hypothetical protein